MLAQRSRALAIVLAAVVSDYIGVTMMRVTLPFYAKTLGGSGTFVGSLETIYGLGQWVGALSLPRLSDSWGRKRTLLLCLGCAALGYGAALASLAVGSTRLLTLSRFPVGFAKQTVTVSRAVVADVTAADGERSRWMSFLGTALAVGCSVGPILGSQAAEHLGELSPVVAAASLFVLLLPLVACGLPETLPSAAKADKTGGAGAARGPPLWRSRRVLLVLGVLALPELGLVAHQGVTLNTFSVHHLGLGKVWVANLNAVSAVMQAAFAGTVCTALAGRGWSDAGVLQLGAASFAWASLVIWCGQSPEAVMASAMPAALANAVLRSIPAAFLSKQVPESRQGEAMGLMDLCSSGLRVLAPVLAGAFMDSFGGGSVFLGQAALFVGAGLGLALFSGEGAGQSAANGARAQGAREKGE